MARRERGKHIPSPEECAYNVFLRVISIFGGSKMMNLLDKFETVTIMADVRITPEDKAFCEAHQAAYDAAVQSFQELAFFWADMENTQKELLGGSDTSYLSSRDGPEISQRQINKHLEHLHWAVIYNIVHYFNSTYHVSVSADHVADNLLPQRPDLKMYENKEAHDTYHKKLRAAKIRYEDVVDQIIRKGMHCSPPAICRTNPLCLG